MFLVQDMEVEVFTMFAGAVRFHTGLSISRDAGTSVGQGGAEKKLRAMQT